MKSYTGGQGYVYQYYFVGKRRVPAGPSQATATEFIFDVTSDRKTTFSASVFLPDGVTSAWAASHGRSLTEAEQYGAAKMRLFEAFDQVENMMASGRQLPIDAPALDGLLASLGIE
jgi:hypothetical protein